MRESCPSYGNTDRQPRPAIYGGRNGEILVRGDNVMLGYYKNPESTAQAIDKDGWLHTGDLGIMDADGNLFIKGRSKNMLLGPSGQNIYPEEIEEQLNNLPYVAECIVIQQKDNKLATNWQHSFIQTLKLPTHKA